MTREIPQSQWTDFLDEFSRTHRSWLATVDSVSGGNGVRTRATERALRSVSPDIEANRIVSVDIRFQEDGESRSPIHIPSPTTIRVVETPEGTAGGVEIVDRDGSCTRIRFRSAPRGEMLDGVAPGELSNQ